ncbi:aminotransferase class I and II [Kribbella flavida DSM 17836]|uniref:Aminotransferase n=1 Tax=Kribbella flavida (strain DSM 17836 / JCM 10339 / NBRC 14399) TaxID=479435 RepID=D2PPJ4_KRIFD|nr:succinyldiaminopimelate transaminase [Kribbella flavida]ADB30956.1 aminotransferase class I and II [Kribbella flavida DSM 17836]
MTDLFSSSTSSRLPDFPWDKLAPFKQKAAAHPDGIVDLSIGSPVDPVPELVKQALADAADAPAYPTTIGTSTARQAVVDWLARRLQVPGVDPQAGVLPVIGTKELIMLLPTLLGVGAGDTVLIPDLAYPTYEAGAALARATSVPVPDVTRYDGRVRVAYLNSPRNPSGQITPAEELRAAVEWARANGVLLVSDECYVEFGWDEQPASVLHPDVCGGSFDNLLAVHSLSKRSNLAGYRAGFVAGDERVVAELLAVRKHAGLMVPSPIQAAMAAAFADDAHVEQQRQRYIRRRSVLREALTGAGWQITLSQGGLYLWAEHPAYDAYGSVAALADRGILVAPGAFYGAAGERHVRVALTGTDERVDAAAKRLHE